ncbi:hypothetical protein [Azospirillum himalayense]|uniref:Uncharacterized protein n=1 Tax=Azospirillum himalayense TaxID=654847 RepID=A0ABW0G190_9PROT
MILHSHLRPAVPRLRALPYPFLGALAISSDAEGFEAGFFHALMSYLNGRGRTPFGKGLGLEVTTSLFFYDRTGASLAYFAEPLPGAARGREADRLDDCLRAGWIDTNHAFGDFEGGGFTRDHALYAYEALGRLGVKLPVFTNHGSADNRQNVGTDADYHAGDRPGDPAYHSDLFAAQGVRFVWTDSLCIETPRPDPEPLLQPETLQDGTALLGVRRLRGTGRHAPNLTSLTSQIRLLALERLYAGQGVAVLYQHLGVLRRAPDRLVPGSIDEVLARPELFLAPFRHLARERDEGRLWVAGLARLLRYAEAVSSVRLSGGQGIGRIELHDPPHAVLDPAGLTLYIDPSLPVAVLHHGRELPIRHNGPDETGRYSVTVAQDRLPDIWS